MDTGHLRLVFGRQAYVIHQRALGIDPTPVYPPRRKPGVSEEITLPADDNDDERLLGILYGLVERCSRRLRNRGLVPGKAGLLFRYADHMEVIRRTRLSHGSSWDFDLYEPLEAGTPQEKRIDREEFAGGLKLYYEAMGWDAETGIPTDGRLAYLGLEWLIEGKRPSQG